METRERAHESNIKCRKEDVTRMTVLYVCEQGRRGGKGLSYLSQDRSNDKIDRVRNYHRTGQVTEVIR